DAPPQAGPRVPPPDAPFARERVSEGDGPVHGLASPGGADGPAARPGRLLGRADGEGGSPGAFGRLNARGPGRLDRRREAVDDGRLAVSPLERRHAGHDRPEPQRTAGRWVPVPQPPAADAVSPGHVSGLPSPETPGVGPSL